MSQTLKQYYKDKKVLVTGDTGFKGSWLCWWLHRLGAKVYGIALPPNTSPNLFQAAGLENVIDHQDIDIRDLPSLKKRIQEINPDFLFHLAAQPIVRESYRDPVYTFSTNVMGTAHVIEALRSNENPCAAVMITSDKCYENVEWIYSYREIDSMGGYDPYSASKGCSELVISSYRRSFFQDDKSTVHIASARAGNVIGPGDWADDRILPDIIQALQQNRPVGVRNPGAVRPWQHVLEPLSGYLWLGAKLRDDNGRDYAEAWNFGPAHDETRTVRELVEEAVRIWGKGRWEDLSDGRQHHEANLLRLSIDKASQKLYWKPVWDFPATVSRTIEGYRTILANLDNQQTIRNVLSESIEAYSAAATDLAVPWAE